MFLSVLCTKKRVVVYFWTKYGSMVAIRLHVTETTNIHYNRITISVVIVHTQINWASLKSPAWFIPLAIIFKKSCKSWIFCNICMKLDWDVDSHRYRSLLSFLHLHKWMSGIRNMAVIHVFSVYIKFEALSN